MIKKEEKPKPPPSRPTPLQCEPNLESDIINNNEIIRSIYQELKLTIGTKSLSERKGIIKNLQLRYHPDKNLGKEDEFKNVFQFLMQYKEWYLLGERK